MKYKEFIEYMSDATELPEEVIRLVMEAVPEVLLYLQDDEYVRTPLGTFKLNVWRGKETRLFGKEWIKTPPKKQVRLRSGKRLVKDT